MRILILSAKTGSGHMRAAHALESAIMESDENAQVLVVDALEYVSDKFNKLVVDGYKYAAMKTPGLYGFSYKFSNSDNATSKAVQSVNAYFAKRLVPLLREFKPDAAVTTHPFASIMFARLRERGYTNIPLISIITDFAPHMAYINSGTSKYIVSSQQMVDSLAKLGVPREDVYPVGIPIDPVFYKREDNKEDLATELGLNPSLQTVLIMAGSFGVTDILKIYDNINDIDLDFQIVVITGKNEKLFNEFNFLLNMNEDMRIGKAQPYFPTERLKNKEAKREKDSKKGKSRENLPSRVRARFRYESLKSAAKRTSKKLPFARHYKSKDKAGVFKLSDSEIEAFTRRHTKTRVTKRTKLIYFTNEVHKYMHVSDLIVTKPGGLTVSESLASCLPMVIFNAIPGQESDNMEYLCDNNLAIEIKKNNAAEVICRLLKYPERLRSMRESCDRMNNKDSAKNVYEVIKAAVAQMNGEPVVSYDDESEEFAEDIDFEEIYKLIEEYREEAQEKQKDGSANELL